MDINFLLDLTSKGLELWRSGDLLHYRIPDSLKRIDVEATIKSNKASLIEIFDGRHGVVGPFRLSPAVRSLLLTEQMLPGNTANILRCPLHVALPLDVKRLQRAIERSVRQHPMLRACFLYHDTAPYLFFEQSPEVSIAFVGDSEINDETLRQWLTSQATATFDLSIAPLVRFHVLSSHSRADSFYLAISGHHAVIDFQSLEVLLNDITADFSAASEPESDVHDARALCLADHSRLQRHSFTPANAELKKYWEHKLPLLVSSAAVDDRDEQSYLGEELHIEVPAALCEKIANVAQESCQSQFSFYFAVFCLAHRCFFERNAVIGVSTSCRDAHPTPGIVGCYVNSLPVLSTSSTVGATFKQWLRSVSQELEETLKSRSFPLSELARLSKIERRARRPVIFDSLFTWLSFDSTSGPTSDASQSVLRPSIPMSAGVTHDLVLSIHAQATRKWLVWSYDTNIFDERLVSTLSTEYLQSLERAIDKPDHVFVESEKNPVASEGPQDREEFFL